jgi:hypothetical protein
MAKVVGRDVPKRKVGRKFAGDSAREILKEAKFGRGREAIFLTAGQFSSVDWIDAILDYTGEADATIATWTAASADLDRVDKWIQSSRIRACSWIVDRSFPNRQPAICDAFRARFGDDSIRVFATHAKFSLIWNDAGWRVVCLTSANLNLNARTEMFHAAEDPELFEHFKDMVDDIFKVQAPGEGFESDAGKAKPMKHLKQRSLFEKASKAGLKTALQVGLK